VEAEGSGGRAHGRPEAHGQVFGPSLVVLGWFSGADRAAGTETRGRSATKPESYSLRLNQGAGHPVDNDLAEVGAGVEKTFVVDPTRSGASRGDRREFG
jgi:hypothetical protein